MSVEYIFSIAGVFTVAHIYIYIYIYTYIIYIRIYIYMQKVIYIKNISRVFVFLQMAWVCAHVFGRIHTSQRPSHAFRASFRETNRRIHGQTQMRMTMTGWWLSHRDLSEQLGGSLDIWWLISNFSISISGNIWLYHFWTHHFSGWKPGGYINMGVSQKLL